MQQPRPAHARAESCPSPVDSRLGCIREEDVTSRLGLFLSVVTSTLAAACSGGSGAMSPTGPSGARRAGRGSRERREYVLDCSSRPVSRVNTTEEPFVAGGSAIVDFALLGFWPRRSLKALKNVFPVLMAGFALNAITGVSIFMKDATMVLLVVIHRRVFDNPEIDRVAIPGSARVLAWASLACWAGAIIAGRLIAYVGPVPGL